MVGFHLVERRPEVVVHLRLAREVNADGILPCGHSDDGRGGWEESRVLYKVRHTKRCAHDDQLQRLHTLRFWNACVSPLHHPEQAIFSLWYQHVNNVRVRQTKTLREPFSLWYIHVNNLRVR